MDKSGYSAGIAQVSKLIWKKFSNLPYKEAIKPERFQENMYVAAKFLKHNYEHYHNWKLALAAYNAGETVTDKVLRGQRSFSPITQRYIAGFDR
jgi:hypothetical protein